MLIDWNGTRKINTVLPKHLSAFQEIVEKNHLLHHTDLDTTAYLMTRDEAKKLTVK